MADTREAPQAQAATQAQDHARSQAGTQAQDHARTQAGAHTVFYACKYTPLELLQGFGAQTKLAETDVVSFDRADALAHPNLCGYGKGLIERLLEPDVHEVVLITCCDVIKRVYDVLKQRR
ncbi:MAG: hypothetical protein ACOX4F_03040 [Atopobiaceae bacterium]